ncbi:unnamed protein product, partial [Rotaria sp. Silwood2]
MALRDENASIKIAACRALGNTCQKTTMDDIIKELIATIGDLNIDVSDGGYFALLNL